MKDSSICEFLPEEEPSREWKLDTVRSPSSQSLGNLSESSMNRMLPPSESVISIPCGFGPTRGTSEMVFSVRHECRAYTRNVPYSANMSA